MDADNDGIITIDEFMEACRTVKITAINAYNLRYNSISLLCYVRSGPALGSVRSGCARPDLE